MQHKFLTLAAAVAAAWVFGLPALAGWLLAKLDELNGSLRGFIMG